MLLVTKKGYISNYKVADRNKSNYYEIQGSTNIFVNKRAKVLVRVQDKRGRISRRSIRANTLRKYVYYAADKSFQLPVTGKLSADQEAMMSVSKKLKIENRIRQSLREIPGVNSSLADKFPVAYDADADMYVVNDYRGKHPIPVEIKIRYNRSIDNYEVIQYQFRSRSDNQLQSKIQSKLNQK